MSKIASNIYAQQQSAKSFEKATQLDVEVLKKIGEFIYKHSTKYHLRLLDTGTGTGRTILGILAYFNEHKIKIEADCYDVSPFMLEQFNDKLRLENYEYSSCINVILHDANKGLERFQQYDIALFVSVLHYFDDWRQYLGSLIANNLKKDGTIVIAELIGWYRWLDGQFDQKPKTEQEKNQVLFWEKYFSVREKYGEWKTEISFSNLDLVYEFLLSKGMSFEAEKEFLWEISISWNEILQWIQYAPVSSLGSNIKKTEDRKTLKGEMRDFLLEKKIDLNEIFKASWGFNIRIFKKHE